MAPEEFTALEAQIEALDNESACRVARLVIECGASIPLAMLAVADANAGRRDVAARQLRPSTPHRRLVQLRSNVVARDCATRQACHRLACARWPHKNSTFLRISSGGEHFVDQDKTANDLADRACGLVAINNTRVLFRHAGYPQNVGVVGHDHAPLATDEVELRRIALGSQPGLLSRRDVNTVAAHGAGHVGVDILVEMQANALS